MSLPDSYDWQTITVCNVAGGTAVTSSDNGSAGSPITGNKLDLSGPLQRWIIVKSGDGWVFNSVAYSNVMALADSSNGTPVLACSEDAKGQVWKVYEAQTQQSADKAYNITNVAHGSEMNLAGGSSKDGTTVQGYAKSIGDEASMWYLTIVGGDE